MKATMLLKRDHAEVNGLFDQLERATDVDHREELWDRLRTELEIHTQIEEDLFYPACRAFPELKDRIQESIQEHRIIRQLCAEIGRLDTGDDAFDDRVRTLRDNLQNHMDTEENEVFPLAKKHLSDDRLDDIGNELEKRRSALMRKGKKALAPA